MRHTKLIIACLAGLLIAGASAIAVEKVEKKRTTESPKKVTEPAKPASPAKPTAPTPPAKKGDAQKKKYDDFIDKNKNGVDDRKEKPGR